MIKENEEIAIIDTNQEIIDTDQKTEVDNSLNEITESTDKKIKTVYEDEGFKQTEKPEPKSNLKDLKLPDTKIIILINETKNCVKYIYRKFNHSNQLEEIKIPDEWYNDKIKVCDFSEKDKETEVYVQADKQLINKHA